MLTAGMKATSASFTVEFVHGPISCSNVCAAHMPAVALRALTVTESASETIV